MFQTFMCDYKKVCSVPSKALRCKSNCTQPRLKKKVGSPPPPQFRPPLPNVNVVANVLFFSSSAPVQISTLKSGAGGEIAKCCLINAVNRLMFRVFLYFIRAKECTEQKTDANSTNPLKAARVLAHDVAPRVSRSSKKVNLPSVAARLHDNQMTIR